MPNFVTNRLTVYGDIEKIEELKEFVKDKNDSGEDLDFSLNKIIPMPRQLNIIYGGLERTIDVKKLSDVTNEKLLRTYVVSFARTYPEEKEILNAIKAVRNYQEFGYRDWYDWRIAKWGTKWDVDYASVDENIFYFDTAHSAPKPVIKELSKRFPTLGFKLEYADEDIGSNCGMICYRNGELSSEYRFGGTEAIKFACRLHGYDEEEYLNQT